MAMNINLFLCVMLVTLWAVSSNPVMERRAVKLVKLNKAQSQQAAKDFEALLKNVLRKLEDKERGGPGRGNDKEGLEVAVEAPESVDVTAEDVLAALQNAASEASGGNSGLVARQLSGGVDWNPNSGWNANADYTWTSKSGNSRLTAGGGWSQGGGWSAGVKFTLKF